MSIDEMNSNIAARQYKRKIYQQRFFERDRQLDVIMNQRNQLILAIAEAEKNGNPTLAVKLRNTLKGLIDKWNEVRHKVK